MVTAATCYTAKTTSAFTTQNNYATYTSFFHKKDSHHHQLHHQNQRHSPSFIISPKQRKGHTGINLISTNQQHQNYPFQYSTSTSSNLFATQQEGEKTTRKTAKSGAGAADEAEWKSLVLAFQMYKAAYGDLKVPSRFVVPSMAPWPGKFIFERK